jgi:hypothetical protein
MLNKNLNAPQEFLSFHVVLSHRCDNAGTFACSTKDVGLLVSQISPKNAPFGKRTMVFFGSVKTVSTLTKNKD